MAATEQQNAWVSRVLGVTLTDEEAPADEQAADVAPAAGSAVSFAKIKLQWNQARSQVTRQLEALRDIVTAEFDDPETVASSQKILRISEYFNEELANTLDALYGAADSADRATLRRQAGAIAEAYEDFLETDPLIGHLEVNPFMPVEITARLSPPLRELQTQLDAAARRDAA